MKRTMRTLGVLACMLCLGAAASKPATKPATTTSSETLAQKESRLIALRVQEAALEAEIVKEKAATQPAVMELSKLLQSMPKDLWPSLQENAVHKSARDAWVKTDGAGKTVKWSGPVNTITVSGNKIAVSITKTGADIFGAKTNIYVTSIFPQSESASIINLKKGDTVTVVGKVGSVEISSASVRLEMQDSVVEAKP